MPLPTTSADQAANARHAVTNRGFGGAHHRQAVAAILRDNYGWDFANVAAELGYATANNAASARSAVQAGRRLLDPQDAPQRTRRPARRRAPQRTGRPNGEGRCFGVEIEFQGITRDAAAYALQGAGLDAAAEGYNHRVSTWAWKVVPDATVLGGGEAVSPILRGDAGLQAMRTAMRALRQAGATVDTNCGLHVHHDMDGLSGDEIARFVEFYYQRNDTLDRLVSRSRRNRGIGGQHLTAGELVRATNSFRANGTIREYEAPSRYRAINVAAFPKYGTIEIRQHQGTLNGTKAEAWVRLAWAMVEAVKRNTDRQIAHGIAMLGDLTDHADLPQRTMAYLAARMEAL